jgi:ubiquinone/menaquinone biosynthesis C-methylase UbiE
VGCGDGSFAALLAERFDDVVALDADAGQVATAAARCRGRANVRVLQADFLRSGLRSESFDVVTALASVHHLPFAAAAAEARRVLRPGGRLVVLGLWTDTATPADVALNVASTGSHLLLQLCRGRPVMSAPVCMERTTWVEVKASAAEHLPTARLERHLLWRYTLVWDKPGG